MNIKKLLNYLVVAAIMMSAATFVSSCSKDGENGKDGKDGVDGKDGENGKDGKDAAETFVVTFDFDNGDPAITQTVPAGGWVTSATGTAYFAKIFVPATPGLYTGNLLKHVFDGWTHNGARFDFSTPITADITLKARWKPPLFTPVLVSEVPVNNIDAAVAYAKLNPGNYAMVINADINAGAQTLDFLVHFGIIGIGGERIIQYTGVPNAPLFLIDNRTVTSAASLELGPNVTLRGIASSTTNLVRVENGHFTMYPGSKITGHTTTSPYGAVYVTGAENQFIMDGGEISGNHSGAVNSSGGVFVDNGASFDMYGGSITGNTINPAAAMDVVLSGAASIDGSVRYTRGVVGTSIPAAFAGN